jgi:hypothetical protein
LEQVEDPVSSVKHLYLFGHPELPPPPPLLLEVPLLLPEVPLSHPAKTNPNVSANAAIPAIKNRLFFIKKPPLRSFPPSNL